MSYQLSIGSCEPHDVLKLCYWTRHDNVELLPDFLKNTSLASVIARHHRRRWISDRLASAMARPFFDGTDFVKGDLDSGTLFFIPVYEVRACREGAIAWKSEDRRRVQEHIWEIYEEEYRKGGADWLQRANVKVNDLLKYFPADTWAPFASLRSHHIITFLLHEQGEGSLKDVVNRSIREKNYAELIVLVFSIEESAFHRLRELREFHKLRDSILNRVAFTLCDALASKYGASLPTIRIGDELITVTVDRSVKRVPIVKAVLRMLAEEGVRCIVRAIRVRVKRENSRKRRKPYYVVASKPSYEEYYVGASLEEGVVRGKAEFARYLDRYRLIEWMLIEPREGLIGSCEWFVRNYAVKVMNRLVKIYGLEAMSTQRAEFLASPDLMLTMVEDYNRFLSDIARGLGRWGEFVIRGFSRSLIVAGIRNISDAMRVHENVLKLKTRLHIPINVTSVATYSKFPFWRVIELMSKYTNTLTIYLRGGVPLSLKEEDFRLMMKIIPAVKQIAPTVWNNEILPAAARSVVELEFELERLTSGTRKIRKNVAEQILRFAKELDENHRDEDEATRRRVRLAAFERLADFTKQREKG